MEVLKECYLCYKSTSGHDLLPPTHININWTTSPGTARATPTNLKNEKLCVCNTHNPKWICKKRIKPASDIIANSHYPSCTQRRVACLFPFFFTISAWKIIEEPEKRSLFCHKKYSVQLFSRVRLFATPWIAARQASLSITISQSLLKFMSIELIMPSNHLILCCSPPPPAFSLSQHRSLFQWVSFSHQAAKVLKLQFQYQTIQWIFRVDFLWDWLVWSP